MKKKRPPRVKLTINNVPQWLMDSFKRTAEADCRNLSEQGRFVISKFVSEREGKETPNEDDHADAPGESG